MRRNHDRETLRTESEMNIDVKTVEKTGVLQCTLHEIRLGK